MSLIKTPEELKEELENRESQMETGDNYITEEEKKKIYSDTYLGEMLKQYEKGEYLIVKYKTPDGREEECWFLKPGSKT